MGQFSWLYSNSGKQMVNYKDTNSYLLVPEHLQEKYGKYIKETCYDGYGNMGGYDVFDLVVEWNKEYLDQSMLRMPAPEQWGKGYEESYIRALELYNKTIEQIEMYKNGATDKDMAIKYGDSWKRNLGISIACYDEQNVELPFPIKITSNPMEYSQANPSNGDPDQGWE